MLSCIRSKQRACAVAKLDSQINRPALSNIMEAASKANACPAIQGGFVRIRGCLDNGAASAQIACSRYAGTLL